MIPAPSAPPASDAQTRRTPTADHRRRPLTTEGGGGRGDWCERATDVRRSSVGGGGCVRVRRRSARPGWSSVGSGPFVRVLGRRPCLPRTSSPTAPIVSAPRGSHPARPPAGVPPFVRAPRLATLGGRNQSLSGGRPTWDATTGKRPARDRHRGGYRGAWSRSSSWVRSSVGRHGGIVVLSPSVVLYRRSRAAAGRLRREFANWVLGVARARI